MWARAAPKPTVTATRMRTTLVAGGSACSAHRARERGDVRGGAEQRQDVGCSFREGGGYVGIWGGDSPYRGLE